MKTIKVCMNKDYFTENYRRYIMGAVFHLVEDIVQLPDEKNSRGESIETFKAEATEDMAEVILAMSDYDMLYAEEII